MDNAPGKRETGEVESLADLISREIAPEPGRANAPRSDLIDLPLAATGTETEPRGFEIAVFNFFLANNDALGIDAVWRCRNARIDGLLDLADGRRVALEIKYRMNWEKACQACAQFGWYRTRLEASAKPLASGLVVFESFTADWARKKASSLLEYGWSYFYADHQSVEGLRVDLVRFRDGHLESLPSALAAAQDAAG
jgi:hypothetical protein